MTLQYLCKQLDLPNEVIREIERYKNQQKKIIEEKTFEQLKKSACQEQILNKIKEQIGEDPFGFYILAELLDCACYTYKEYIKMKISETVFIDTMKFCTRFINEHKKVYGYYAFTWEWWFPRQLSMKEFRIGELEYEFIDNDVKKINIHIPSDANMHPKYIKESITKYHDFLRKYYPEWEKANYYCESWLLSPALKQLLPESSNIIMFQNLFDIEDIDYESMAVLDWVFPGIKAELSDLPENTSLQRNMKKFLLNGNKIGWAKGKMK